MRFALVLALSTGCSAFLVHGPTQASASGEELDCTSSVAAPVIDTLLAAALIAGTIHYANLPGPRGDVGAPPEVYLGLLSTGFAGSALVGFLRTDECRYAKKLHAQWNQSVTAL